MFRSATLMGNRIAAGGGFTPADINPLRDIDATDSANIFQDAAKTIPVTTLDDPLGAVVDNGSLAEDITQSGTSRPLYKPNSVNGHASILFDGVNDFMKTSGGVATLGPFELWFVMDAVSASTGNDYILFNDAWSATASLELYLNGAGIGSYADPGFPGWGGFVVGAGYHIIRYILDGASSSLTHDNGTPVTGTTVNTGMKGLCIGADYSGATPAKGRFCQIIMTDGRLSGGDTSSMWTFFGDKYNKAV